MLLSYSIPYMEIKRSKSPVALVISAGYIKPHSMLARGNYFVVNVKRVRGIYNINNKQRFMLENVPIYWYAVQESNPIDPIMINKINNFMKQNSIVTLEIKDIRHGSRLRILNKRMEHQEAQEFLTNSEETDKNKMFNGLKTALPKLQEAQDRLSAVYQKPVPLSSYRKSNIVLKHLNEEEIITEEEYKSYLQKIDTEVLNFDTLIDDLKISHQVNITYMLDEETEKFIHMLGKQNAQQMAGVSQDLRATKRGLKEMLSKPINSTLSWYLMIPASLVVGLAPKMFPNIELHLTNSPIAIIIYKRKLYLKKIYGKNDYFVINDELVGGIYRKSIDSQYMWGKVPCYIYHLEERSKLSRGTIKHLFNQCIKKKLSIEIRKKKQVSFGKNKLLTYLEKENKIRGDIHQQMFDRINQGKMNFDQMVEQLKDQIQDIQIIEPLNVEVEGFIDTLGSVNAQEWASFTQDLRNNLKALKDMTSKPVKNFLSAGVILSIGIVGVMAVAVLGSGGGAGFSKMLGGSGNHTGGGLGIPGFGGHFVDILNNHIPHLLGYMHTHLPGLMGLFQ